jgi:hypothetical protein
LYELTNNLSLRFAVESQYSVPAYCGSENRVFLAMVATGNQHVTFEQHPSSIVLNVFRNQATYPAYMVTFDLTTAQRRADSQRPPRARANRIGEHAGFSAYDPSPQQFDGYFDAPSPSVNAAASLTIAASSSTSSAAAAVLVAATSNSTSI